MAITKKKILLGFDFSRGAHAAAQAVSALVDEGEIALVEVAVVLTRGVDPMLRKELLEEGVRPDELELAARVRIADDARAALRHLEKDGPEYTYRVYEGSVDRALFEAAQKLDADLIVIGAVGKDAEDSPAKVGTDTFRLVRRSTIPVLVVKRDSTFPPKTALAAVDGSGASEHALNYARELTQSFDTSVTALHIREGASDGMSVFSNLEALNGYQGYKKSVKEGVPHRVLSTMGREFDLLTIGSVGRHAVAEFLLGGTAERVLRNLPCSMLFVKEPR